MDFNRIKYKRLFILIIVAHVALCSNESNTFEVSKVVVVPGFATNSASQLQKRGYTAVGQTKRRNVALYSVSQV